MISNRDLGPLFRYYLYVSALPCHRVSQAFIHISVLSSHCSILRIFNTICGLCFPEQEAFDMRCIFWLEIYNWLLQIPYFVKICSIFSPEIFYCPASVWNNCLLSLLHSYHPGISHCCSSVLNRLYRQSHIYIYIYLILDYF